MLWKDGVPLKIESYSNHHIESAIESKANGSFWRFTGFYGHWDSAQRVTSWTILKRMKNNTEDPWLCGGDLNEILNHGEKKVSKEAGELDE